MKKVIFIFLVLATLVCLCAGCGKSSEKATIYVYNWGQYIAEGDDDGSAGVIAHARKIKQGNADGKKHNAKQHDKHAAQRQIAKAGKHGATSGSW